MSEDGALPMKENEFLLRVQELGALPTQNEAKRWAMAVVQALADLLADAQARRHFISQLPGGLKATARARAPRGLLMDREAFIQHVAAILRTHAPEGGLAARTVYRVLTEAVSAGQIADFEAHVPGDIVAFLESGA